MIAIQGGLFTELQSTETAGMPNGFRYQDDTIGQAEEAALAASLATIELKPFEFHGHFGNRRVASFGLRYDYSRHAIEPADEFPLFVRELRRKVATFAQRNIDEFQQGGVNEYPPGAGIVGTWISAIWSDR